MGNKKVCDWCEKVIGLNKNGYRLGESESFVHTIQTTLAYYNPRRNDLPEPTEKTSHKIEICDNCYHSHIAPIFSWYRDLIVYPESRAEAEHLQKESKIFREDFNKKLEAEHELFKERARREAEKKANE